jgi:hypothetical protein
MTTLTLDDLRAATERHVPDPACPCEALRCPGWESLPATFDAAALLERVGSLRAGDAYDEPTLEEHHPEGTRYDAPEAPVSLAHFPYNRCELWRCVRCARPFLRYTEYGGYYVDARIRELDARRLVDPA